MQLCSLSSDNVRTIVAGCVGLVFLEKKRKRNIVWEFGKMFETMIGVELLEGNKLAVCVHTTNAKGFLVWCDGTERCVHCN